MENIEWKLKELKDAVQSKHGQRYSDRISDPLNTFGSRNAMSGYHASEYQRILDEKILSATPATTDDLSINNLVLAMHQALHDSEKGAKLLAAKFQAEAHIIASAQSLHALCDILANIIYLALKLDSYPDPLREDKIDLTAVKKILKKNSIYVSIQQSISNIIPSSEFKYLNAFVNTSKHKILVPSTLSASFLGKKSGILLNEFTYKGVLYDKKWSQDFIFKDNQKLKGELLSAGNMLNDVLK